MRKLGYIAIITFSLLFLIPIGKCASKVYLSPGQFINKNISVKEGDIVRGDYETYDSSFYVGIGYCYLGDCDVFTTFYTSGWFEIEILSGSGTLSIALTNVDIYSGYLEYTIGKEGDDDAPANLMPIIIGGVIIGLVGACIGIGIGISIHSKNKKRRIIEDEELQESTANYCPNCGSKLEGAFCTKCGSTAKYCSNCGSKLEGAFCTKCGKGQIT